MISILMIYMNIFNLDEENSCYIYQGEARVNYRFIEVETWNKHGYFCEKLGLVATRHYLISIDE